MLALGLAGCNAILDNNPGQLRETGAPTEGVSATDPVRDGGASLPSLDASTSTPVEPRVDAAPTPPVVSDAGTLTCGAGERICQGLCVSVADPRYGCGDPGCAPCIVAHGAPTCQANACAVQTCDPGYADCNGNAADGCEVDLSLASSCGACNAVCPAANPVCAPGGAGFQCTTGCAPDAPLLCGDQCVAPLTSVNHCGGCGNKCPEIDQATTTCSDGRCQFACDPGYHACGNRCLVTTDPNACGPGCTTCPSYTNSTPTCQNDACGHQCNSGFADCNADLLDGCEAELATNPNHCGACGNSCNGGTCTAGVCSAPPPPPPPPGDAGGG